MIFLDMCYRYLVRANFREAHIVQSKSSNCNQHMSRTVYVSIKRKRNTMVENTTSNLTANVSVHIEIRDW